MSKQNCWEFKKCGRETGGAKSSELGTCKASTETTTNGINEGDNGGRVCWAISGTLCKGEIQGTFAKKLDNCLKCEFYLQVTDENGRQYKITKEVLDMIENSTSP